MILSCPTCPSRYRFDESRLPAGGSPVRCKNCRTVFRAVRPSSESAAGIESSAELDRREHGVRAASAPDATVVTKTKTPPAEAVEPATFRPAPSAKSSKTKGEQPPASVSVPVRVVPPESSPAESDIRRLTRIIFSDIVIYGPEKADKAIRQGRFVESYKTEIEEGKKIIRSRFPSDTAKALETFQRCLEELLEARKKELQAAVAL